ncbi:ferric-chelate reductase 1-like [Dysidea avara]|uniref:ferric-chelate reductase 1-like n=1 Tax=Dysidea avara TaxID=196820 RepID=UPI00331EBD76
MKLKLFVYVLFSTVPGLLARSTGAPPQACNDMMPRHGVNSQPTNNGYFIISDAVNSCSPGEDYLVELRANSDPFLGFFIQARVENNQGSTTSIVGVWTPLNTTMARTATCNGVDGDAVTHSSPVVKQSQFFMWRAPDNDVGRIHFIYSIAQAYSTIYVRLNATVERPSGVIGPPSQPPVDAVFPYSYGQPEDCKQDECYFYVEWRNNGDFIDFRMEGDASGWIALGLSGANTPLDMVGRVFSDILMCQAESTGSVANVKDMYLAGGSVNPLFDSSVNGTEFTSGRIVSGRIFCNFSRVGFVLLGQEGQDVSFSDDNFLFFLFGDDTGMAGDIPEDFNTSVSDAEFSSTAINLERPILIPVHFFGSINSLHGRGSFPSDDCDPSDCDFYFRWGVNPNNSDYLTFFISADIGRGWAAIGVSPDRRMGGEKIDDVFGCITRRTGDGDDVIVAAIDTYNIRGGGRENVGDGITDGIVLHNGSIVDARITCIFSRVISVLPESEASDLNLDNSYYIMIGIGEFPGSPDSSRTRFLQHEHTPLVSTSKVNLVTVTSVNFDYSKIILIKLHGIFMIVAWPLLAYMGTFLAANMKPALPNGEWFQAHRIFMILALFLSCLGFILIFVAFHNAPTRGLITLGELNKTGTAHFILGIILTTLIILNPILAIFRCKPDSDNRWIFNIIHGVAVGVLTIILSGVNIGIGLYLFAEKYASHEEQGIDAFGAVITFIIIYIITYIVMNIYTKVTKKYKDKWVVLEEEGKRKNPSQDYLFRWVIWISMFILSILFTITAIALVSSA